LLLVAVGGLDRVVDVDVAGLAGAGQDRGVHGQVDQEPGGDGIELADVAERERPQERAQRGRGPDPGEQTAHPAMSQHIHVINGIRADDHPGDQRGDLQVRVHTANGLQGQRGRHKVGQTRPLRQRHRRGQPGARHQIWVIEDRGNRRGTMRNSHSADALLCG
jgi:hypothetical protein